MFITLHIFEEFFLPSRSMVPVEARVCCFWLLVQKTQIELRKSHFLKTQKPLDRKAHDYSEFKATFNEPRRYGMNVVDLGRYDK